MLEPQRLHGKVAVVTGAGSDLDEGLGTGVAIARVFAREGAQVAILDVDVARASNTAKVLKEDTGRDALVVELDVTSAIDCEAAISKVDEAYGHLDILVNNVGITTKQPAGAAETSEEDWDRLFAVNLKSAFLMSKYAIPKLAENGGGSIVNISSVAAERGYPACAYSASKLGMNALTVDTAVAYGRLGIRANAVEPGFINTPMSERLVPGLDAAGRQARHEARIRSTPLGTEGTAWDIAHAALFFASDEARWVTGQVIAVDGGILAQSPRLTGD